MGWDISKELLGLYEIRRWDNSFLCKVMEAKPRLAINLKINENPIGTFEYFMLYFKVQYKLPKFGMFLPTQPV